MPTHATKAILSSAQWAAISATLAFAFSVACLVATLAAFKAIVTECDSRPSTPAFVQGPMDDVPEEFLEEAAEDCVEEPIPETFPEAFPDDMPTPETPATEDALAPTLRVRVQTDGFIFSKSTQAAGRSWTEIMPDGRKVTIEVESW